MHSDKLLYSINIDRSLQRTGDTGLLHSGLSLVWCFLVPHNVNHICNLSPCWDNLLVIGISVEIYYWSYAIQLLVLVDIICFLVPHNVNHIYNLFTSSDDLLVILFFGHARTSFRLALARRQTWSYAIQLLVLVNIICHIYCYCKLVILRVVDQDE